MTLWDPVELLEVCASAVAWFSTNWLHPLPAIRMAIVRLLGDDEIEAHLSTLLTSDKASMFLKAHWEAQRVNTGRSACSRQRMCSRISPSSALGTPATPESQAGSSTKEPIIGATASGVHVWATVHKKEESLGLMHLS